ncbi:FumA C-terminus/TtdB family hydratase beta subunit [Streptomyces odontomachi]|uniref:FumA C-terminus/TtdB family hydratase beta subunit n=1 Tax=Streptomyces odontomachi TaxID=2944940 RepID=UPI00210B0C42|nr:FumA C-terminus/TtdB family hydratase beta subunit [Streptomyces sp. ODS25]
MVIPLTTPLTPDALRELRVGDQVTITGTVWGLRDATLIHWQDQEHTFPADLSGAVLLHTQPNVKKDGDDWVPLCVGTTTSQRMDRFTRPLLERLGVRAILGKGGLSADSAAAMAEHGCVYLAVVGGAASLETQQIEKIENVYWEHLMPECLWQFRVRDLGPLFVGIDCHGNNLHADIAARSRERLAEVIAE